MRPFPALLLTALAVPTPQLMAQLQWSVFDENATVTAPVSTASSGLTVSVAPGQRATLIATNFAPIDFGGATNGSATVTLQFRASAGLSSIAGGTRAIGVGLFDNNGTAANFADDSGYFTWLNGRQTGSLIELRRRNGNGASPSLLNPAGTAFSNLGTGSTTQAAGALTDNVGYSIQFQLVRTATGVSLGTTSSTTSGAGVWVSGAGLSQTAFTNPDVPPVATRFNQLAFMFLNATAAPVTLEIISVSGLTPLNPPVIIAQATPLVLNPGQFASLSPAVAGTAPLNYVWRKDGVVIPDATFGTVNFNPAIAADAGTYRFVVSNAFGSVESDPVTVAVTTDPIPPAITIQPAPLAVPAGFPAEFSVRSYGSSPIAYQWRKDGVAIPGATAVSHRIANALPTLAGNYSVVLTNAAGSATSAAAALTVLQSPSFSRHPASVSTPLGRSVTFTAEVVAFPTPALQWLHNGVAIPGATTSTLTIPDVQLAHLGLYALRATNSGGSATSLAARLTTPSAMRAAGVAPANSATAVNADTPLRITFDRAPVVGNFGRIRIMRAADGVAADTIDLGAPTQQRTVGGASAPFNFLPVTVSGNTVSIYPRGGVLTYGQTYYVAIDEGAIRDSLGASYTGSISPTFWRFTTKPSGPASGATTFTVAADGRGDFTTVQGAIDAVPVGNNRALTILVRPGTYFEQVYVAANRPLITLRGEDRAGTVITYPNNNNLNGNVRTRGVLTNAANDFTLETLTVLNTTPQGGSQAEAFVTDGQRVIVNRVNLRSRQDTFLGATGTVLVTDSFIEGNTDFMWGSASVYFHRCELRALDTAGQEGFYTQVRNGQNQVGFVFVECRLTGEPTAARYYLGRVDPNPGNFPFSQAVWIDCAMGPHVLPVGWQLNNATASATVRNWEYQSTDLTGATLDVRARHASSRQIETAAAAQYRDPAFVLGGWSPAIPANVEPSPAGIAFLAGSNASVSVTTTGVPAPSVQWLWNGANVPGATNATLYLPAISDADTGAYRAVVFGAGGTVVGPPINVSLRRGPFAGTYFGSFQGFAPAIQVALHIRDDGTGVFLGDGSGLTGASCRTVIVAPDGSFGFRTLAFPGLNGRGQISTDGRFSGDVAGVVFSGRREPDTGPAARSAGYFSTATPDGPHILSIITGASGQAFFLFEAGTNWRGRPGILVDGATFRDGTISATVVPDATAAIATVVFQSPGLSGPRDFVGTNDRYASRMRLAQVSSRVQVGAAEPAIAGFVIGGTEPVPVLIRAVGPTLGAAFAVPGFLSNPRLDLFRGSDRIATNTGWSNSPISDEIVVAGRRAGAFPLRTGFDDSALLITLAPGAYTAIVSSADGATSGVALVEAYELSGGSGGKRLRNLSTRARVESGASALVAGFSIDAILNKRILLRALGPSLSTFGVSGAIARPTLTLFRGANQIATNTNWETQVNVSNTWSAGDELGLFRLSTGDSAILVSLAGGNYTAQVTSADGSAGTALVEVYELP